MHSILDQAVRRKHRTHADIVLLYYYITILFTLIYCYISILLDSYVNTLLYYS